MFRTERITMVWYNIDSRMMYSVQSQEGGVGGGGEKTEGEDGDGRVLQYLLTPGWRGPGAGRGGVTTPSDREVSSDGELRMHMVSQIDPFQSLERENNIANTKIASGKRYLRTPIDPDHIKRATTVALSAKRKTYSTPM